MHIALVGLMVWGTAAAARGEDLSGLDRGHRILIERGFQLQATTFGTEDPNWWTNGDANGTYWEQSNFTTPHFWVRTPAQQNISIGDPWASALTNLGSHVRHREGLVSWQWRDEEDLDDPAIRAWVKGWFELERPRLPNTLLYTNEGPLQVSDANMRLYMTESQPDMLHLDEYPFRDDTYFNGSPWTLYFQLSRYRELALGGHDGTRTTPIPYGTYVQTFIKTPTGDWWHPSESEARMNQFTAWTMGYKMINTWTFDDTPEGPNVLDSIFFDAPVNSTANPTPEFFWYAELNRQALNLGDSLVRLLSTDLRIVQGEKWPGIFWPDWMDEWDPNADPYITSISAENLGTANDGDAGDVLVGYFEPLLEQFDGPVFEDQTYFMITNGLHDPNTSAADATQRITVDFDFGGSGITSLLKLSRDTGLAEVVALQALGGHSIGWCMTWKGERVTCLSSLTARRSCRDRSRVM
ncbi:MAG: hypothetical protein CMJ49_01880 [Planctomycetaceae bacterium]|nr:hypothetical protein [Planctomycetaceae bacterium]